MSNPVAIVYKINSNIYVVPENLVSTNLTSAIRHINDCAVTGEPTGLTEAQLIELRTAILTDETLMFE
jgi:hypothetical protein